MRYAARLKWLLVLLILPVMEAWTEEIVRPFVPGSYQQIINEHKGKAFLLIFWSTDCPSCFQELKMLGKHINKSLSEPVVLVATDIYLSSLEIQQVLDKYGVTDADSWVFAEENTDRLRFEIDRSWYGELPRSYLFDAAHQRRAITGLLPDAELTAWQEQASKAKVPKN